MKHKKLNVPISSYFVLSPRLFAGARRTTSLGTSPDEAAGFTVDVAGLGVEARMNDRMDGLQKRLAERADKDARDIESKKSIEAELNDPAYVQPLLFDDPEMERFERNKEAMRARVREIPDEIERETEAIRVRFAEPQARMFPVAVTFLIPWKLA